MGIPAPTLSPCESEQAPLSERVPREPLSRVLWGIDWNEHLPIEIATGIVAVPSTYDRALPFVREHYASIFQEAEDSPFSTRVSGDKERYYRLAGDFFEFKREGSTVGLFVGTPVDWSTYYIRSAAVLPDCQRLGLAHGFVALLLDVLRGAGLERVEADTSPSNFATLAVLSRFFFNVTGTTLSDRWGAQLRLTRFLDDRSEQVFLRQFCSGVIHQRRNGSGAAR